MLLGHLIHRVKLTNDHAEMLLSPASQSKCNPFLAGAVFPEPDYMLEGDEELSFRQLLRVAFCMRMPLEPPSHDEERPGRATSSQRGPPSAAGQTGG